MIASDFAESNSAGAVTMGLLDTSSSRCRFTSRLSGQLFARSLSTRRFSCRLPIDTQRKPPHMNKKENDETACASIPHPYLVRAMMLDECGDRSKKIFRTSGLVLNSQHFYQTEKKRRHCISLLFPFFFLFLLCFLML